MRGKIFPSKRRRIKAPEVTPSVALPLRRKERSLSSLVVDTPRVSPQTTLTGKRSKIPPRKKPRFSADKSVKKEDDSVDVQQDSSSSHETSNRFNHKLRQVNKSTKCIPSLHAFFYFLNVYTCYQMGYFGALWVDPNSLRSSIFKNLLILNSSRRAVSI